MNIQLNGMQLFAIVGIVGFFMFLVQIVTH